MGHSNTEVAPVEDWPEPTAKRQRPSGATFLSEEISDEYSAFRSQPNDPEHDYRHGKQSFIEKDRTGSLASSSTMAGQSVAPFLARHIPEQYNPLGKADLQNARTTKNPNSKFCYRHRPDLKCRRQADEPSMDQMQKVCVPSLAV